MRITKIETFVPTEPVDNARVDIFCWVLVHTDEGLVGLGESTGLPGIVAAAIHELVAPFVLGADPADREHLWAQLWAKAEFTGMGGAEVRAMAAVDIALWDLEGQRLGVPLHRLLGGLAHDRLPLYNTCLNGPVLLDQDRSTADHVGDLARELLEQGFTAMKIWPFDPVSPRARDYGRPGGWPLGPIGHRLTRDDLERGLAPVRAIREAVDDRMDIAIEGHGRWDLRPQSGSRVPSSPTTCSGSRTACRSTSPMTSRGSPPHRASRCASASASRPAGRSARSSSVVPRAT